MLAKAVTIVFAIVTFAAFTDAATADVGFRDQSFSGTGTAVTGGKPESKLWWNDGFWWASMWDEVEGNNFIHKLEPVTQTWTNTGVMLDNRSGTRADTLWDGTKLYVASHAFTNTPEPSSAGGRLYRYSYDAASDTYSLDAGFPAAINGWKTEILVLAKDSTGTLWATWNQENTTYVNRTVGGDASWGTPFALPADGAAGLAKDDISSIVAFGDKIGVMWSDQTRELMHFAVHVDGAPASSWSHEVALSGALSADDHINLKVDSAGRVFAAVKTSETSSTKPLTYLLVRTDGTWAKHVFGLKTDRHTRPIVVLDEQHQVIHMFATSGEAGGTIYAKTSEMDPIAFPEGLGTPVIQDSASDDMNDVTSTKQNVTSETGLVVMASDDTTDYYWHNLVGLSQLSLAANFSGEPTSGGVPLEVAFSDLSNGTPTGWTWDFGDGTTSSEQNPTHTYAAAGTYTVTLTVTDDGGDISEKVRANYVTVDPLAAEFTGSPTSGAAPLAVAFTESSTGDPTAWSWDFGDGTTSTEQNPSHTYQEPGAYTVTLTVTGKDGATHTSVRTDYVTALPLTADFGATPTSGAAPLAVTFTDASVGTPTTWSWDFGDGTTSTEQNPSHTYADPGKYTVTLTVTDAAGATSTTTRADAVEALPLTADFEGTPTFAPVPLAVAFTDTSIGTPLTWSWEFGDGSTSTEENPTHTYLDPGTYTVTLTVTDARGDVSTRTRTDYVTASPDAVFSAGADTYANSSEADRNFGGATSVRVRNGDSSPPHYRSFVRFDVSGLGAPVTAAKLRLLVTDAARDGGALYLVDSGWTERGLTWNTAPAISGEPIAMLPSAEVGTSVEVSLPASLFAAGDGAYSFAIKSNEATGGAVWYSSREGSAAPQLVLRVTALPLAANFIGTPTAGAAPLAVAFTDTSDGEATAWSWDFGDGTTSTQQNPSHTYDAAGTYTVTLTVTDADGATSTKTRTDYIAVQALAADFAASPTSGAAPLAVAFTDSSTGAPTAWSWDFGDGTTSTEQNPSHTYTAAGTYTVTLTVTDANGGTSTKTRADYIVAEALAADFTGSPTFGSAPLDVAFTDTSTGTPTTWSWDFGDSTTSSEQNPSHTYLVAGTYTVTLTVTDANGATSTKTRSDYVTAAADIVFGPSGDSFVNSSYPDRNYGGTANFRVRNGDSSLPHYRSFFQFELAGLAAPVTSAKLRLYVVDGASNGGTLYVVGNGWTEGGITWNNAPAIDGTAVAELGKVTAGTWIEVLVPADVFMAGNATYSLAIKSNAPTGGTAWYASREDANRPQLIIGTG